MSAGWISAAVSAGVMTEILRGSDDQEPLGGMNRITRHGRVVTQPRCEARRRDHPVTEVAPAGPFWQAEPEHQDYLERIPNGYTCHFIRPDWKLSVRPK